MRKMFAQPPERILRPLVRAARLPLGDALSASRLASGIATNAVAGRRALAVKAAVCRDTSKPLQVVSDHPLDPAGLKAGHVLIDVHTCGVNFADYLMSQGRYQVKPPLPFVPGMEVAGVVRECHPSVKNLRVGDRIVAVIDNGGGFAEACYVPEAVAVKLPPEIDFERAAAVAVSYGTAYVGLTHRANLQKGENLLVTAAAGGVGLAAVDIAKHVIGARVVAAVGSDAKGKYCADKGADVVLKYADLKKKEAIMAATNNKGANVVFEVVGGDTFSDCLRAIAWEGRVVVIGFASGDIPQVPANILLVKNCSVLGLYWGAYGKANLPLLRNSIEQCVRLCAEGKLNPLVYKTFPLDQINEAFGALSGRESVGKVVVRMR